MDLGVFTMSNIKFTESDLEIAVIEQLQDLGYDYAIDTDQWFLTRSLDAFINEELLLDRLMAINPGVKVSVLEQAITMLKNLFSDNSVKNKQDVKLN